MNDDVVQDLKQFIASTISQQTAEFATKDDINRLATKDDINRLETKVDDLSGAVAEALDTSNEAVGEQIADHDSRITRLEHKVV